MAQTFAQLLPPNATPRQIAETVNDIIRGRINIIAGTNVTLTPGTDSLTIAASGGGGAGTPGAPGVQGQDGFDGEDSYMPGPTGPQGNPGATGAAGTTGLRGEDGVDGLDSFIPGPQGPAGAAGSIGVDGAPGPAVFIVAMEEPPEPIMMPGPKGDTGATGPSGGGGGGGGTVGSATLDFGAAPGTNIATVTVAGQASIVGTSRVEACLMSDATATHNEYEHNVVPMKLTCGSIVVGTSFVITAVTDFRLSGTFTCRWMGDY